MYEQRHTHTHTSYTHRNTSIITKSAYKYTNMNQIFFSNSGLMPNPTLTTPTHPPHKYLKTLLTYPLCMEVIDETVLARLPAEFLLFTLSFLLLKLSSRWFMLRRRGSLPRFATYSRYLMIWPNPRLHTWGRGVGKGEGKRNKKSSIPTISLS